jgi:hypothetical protein
MPLFALRLPVVRRVCRRVAAGETVQDVCRDPLMPLAQEFHGWLAEEPEFAAMMRAARRKSGRAGLARPGRPGLWSEALSREFLGRIEDGRGLVEVCSEPDMPTHTTVYRWLRAKPEFAEAYALARQVQSDLLFDLAWSVARRAADGGRGGRPRRRAAGHRRHQVALRADRAAPLWHGHGGGAGGAGGGGGGGAGRQGAADRGHHP